MKVFIELEKGRSVRKREDQVRVLWQLHCVVQDRVALGMRARDRLTFRMVAKMLAMEVSLEVTARRKGLQSISVR